MHNEPHSTPSIKEEVLNAIERGRARMRPRWHFILGGVLMAISAILVLCITLYVVSFIIFTLKQTGAWFGPAFGARGWLALLFALPWIPILCALLLIATLEILVRRYEFAYQKPLLYSVLVIVSVVAVSGGFVAPLHRAPFRAARENRLPVGGALYRGFGMQRFGDMHRGTVVDMTGNTFIIKDNRGTTSTVIILPETRLPFGLNVKSGDTVIVVGIEKSGIIRAFGLREIEE
jgi:hypothetical protein